MIKPAISVVMPVYNAEEYLEESINSILNQSFEDFEFIIINDGSKDKSEKIVKSFQKKDKRIILINNKKNSGLPITLNKGISQSVGKYIARMDADDISLKDRLKVQYNFLEVHPEIALVGSSAIIIDESGNRIGVLRKFDNYKKTSRKLLKSNPMIHPSIMFRNDLKLRYREKFQSSEEYDLYLRLLSSGKNITNLSDYLIKYRISSGSFVSTKPNQEFYFKKAQEFFVQRKTRKFDEYALLPVDLKTSKKPDYEKNNLYSLILVEIQDNRMKDARRNISHYTKKFGWNKAIYIFYFISFFPYGLTAFIKDKLFP